jgi:hypothetical protein
VTIRLITKLFIDAYCKLSDEPEYRAEIMHVTKQLERPLSEMTKDEFFQQYVFVVLCSYWKEQYAQKEWRKFFESGNLEAISNRRKRAAVAIGINNAERWLEELKQSENPIEYLDTLPMIGEVTRYHLARNIGIDCVKPDRHLVRLAEAFGYGRSNKVSEQYEIVMRMCKDIHNEIGGSEPLGVIDVVLWRWCNLGRF